jgi:hypothetical protein
MKKALFGVIWILFLSCNKNIKEASVSKVEYSNDTASKEKPRSEIKDIDYIKYYQEAEQYCKKNNLNQKKFILIDLGVHSGLKRFFLYDFKNKKISKSYVVSHGCGNNEWGRTFSKEDAPISNEFDSHCSSLW